MMIGDDIPGLAIDLHEEARAGRLQRPALSLMKTVAPLMSAGFWPDGVVGPKRERSADKQDEGEQSVPHEVPPDLSCGGAAME